MCDINRKSSNVMSLVKQYKFTALKPAW